MRRGRGLRLSDAGAVVAFLAVVLVPFVQELTAQPAVRYAQTAAMVEHGELDLDRYRGVLGVDVVEHEGHLYSDKGPLQPLLAVPAFAVGKLAGVEAATELRTKGNLGLWWVTVWMSVVPFLAIAGLGVRVVRRVIGRHEIVAPLALCVGSLLFAYATELYAHTLTALLGWGCWLLVADRPITMRRAVLAGLVAGAAVAVEFQMALAVLVVASVFVARRSWRELLGFVAGGVPAVIGLGIYQWAAWGSPFTVSYRLKPVHPEPTILGVPSPVQLVEILFGSRGLFLFTPVVALGAFGLVLLIRQGSSKGRDHGIVGLAVLIAFLVMQSAWQNPWGGESPGPRYVIPALPFLIVGVAAAWEAAKGIRFVLVAWSVVTMSSVVVSLHLIPDGGLTFVSNIQNLRSYGAVVTVWTMLLGPAGWVVHLATVVAAGWLLRGRIRSAAAQFDHPGDEALVTSGR